MVKQFFNEGARVISLDGEDIGTVEKMTGTGVDANLVVRLTDGSRTMMVPYSVIDEDRSTEDEAYVQGAVGNLLDEQMAIGEHKHDTLELVAEEAEAHVHEVDRGRVLIDKTVEMVPHRADVEVGTDVVDVDRVDINEEFNEPPQTRQEGDTLIVPVIEEVLVVSKRYRVIEEVRITKRRDVHTETFEENLKREVVTVTEEDVDGEIVDR